MVTSYMALSFGKKSTSAFLSKAAQLLKLQMTQPCSKESCKSVMCKFQTEESNI